MSPSPQSAITTERDEVKRPLLKRKQGGRHRIFTNEQRKDRNRLAQAAFRERRSQYTKELESAIEDLEKIITELQESNRATSHQLDEVKEENDNLRQLSLTVILENRNLQSKLNALRSKHTLSESYLKHLSAPMDHPFSPCTSVSEECSDASSITSDNAKMQNRFLTNFVLGCHAENLTQGEFLFNCYYEPAQLLRAMSIYRRKETPKCRYCPC